jgi:serine-type D-Ala-D-Ala carboxypeptidase (penicillin-binding protein 5/6)
VLSKFRPDQIISLFFALILLLIQGGLSLPEPIQAEEEPLYIYLVEPALRPVVPKIVETDLTEENNNLELDANLNSTLPDVSAQSYLVLDIGSAAVLLEKDKDEPLYPASTVKLMSALVAKKSFPLEHVLLTGPEVFIAGNRIGLTADRQVTIIDLIKASLVSSGNDAVQVLAYHHPLGYDGFIRAMNDEARRLSLTNTVFTNSTGFDDLAQHSTSQDLARLALEVAKDPLLKEFITLEETIISDIEGNSLYQLNNTNQLLSQYPQVKGVKTGTTELAGQVLITYWEEEQYSLLVVVMNSQDRYQDTLNLIDWVKTNVSWQEF